MKRLLIISGPSGVGKTVLVEKLVQDQELNLVKNITTTTRNKRDGEENGVDYHFVTRKEFEVKLGQGDFAESADVFGHYYGTSKSRLQESWDKGLNVVLILDWNGHDSLKKVYPELIHSVFLTPPSLDVLRERLYNRGSDSLESIQKRLNQAPLDLEQSVRFDTVICNDDVNEAAKKIKIIIQEIFAIKTKKSNTDELDLGDNQKKNSIKI